MTETRAPYDAVPDDDPEPEAPPDGGPLARKESVVRAVDPERLPPHIRRDQVRSPRRPGRPRRHPPGVVLGWAELAPDAPRAPGGGWYRRVSWAGLTDRGMAEGAGRYALAAPCEAADPQRLWPGWEGALTDRARSGRATGTTPVPAGRDPASWHRYSRVLRGEVVAVVAGGRGAAA